MSKKYLDTVGLNKLVANILSRFAAKNHKHSAATTTQDGFMSANDKVKLDGIAAGANKTIVDSSLSSTSVNPVQNKVVNSALAGKASTSHTHTTTQVSGLDAALAGKAPSSHTHTIAQVTNLQTELDKKQVKQTPITTSGTGSAYTATVSHIKALTAGATFTMIPNVVSTTVSPTLNVNGLGAKQLRQRLSNSTQSTATGATANWLAAGKPVNVMYDGAFWVVDFVRPNMASAYGELPMSNVSGLQDTLNDKANRSHKHPEYIDKSDIMLHTDGVKSGSLNNNVTLFSASNATLFSLSPLYATLTMGALYIVVNESASFSGAFGYIDVPGEFTRIQQCDHPEISNGRWFTTISKSQENKGCTRITFVAAVPFLPSDKGHQWSGAPNIVLLA